MLGELMQPTAEAQPANLEQTWLSALQSPKVQSAMMAFGQQLMMPRWSGSSALPDAMGAAGRTVSGIEQDEYTRTVAAQKRQDQINEQSADRDAAMARTKLMADNRAEVQGLRNQGMIERETYRKSLADPNSYTPQERREAAQVVSQELKLWSENPKNIGKEPPPELRQRAEELAHNIIVGRRARNPNGGVAGPITSQNPATPSGQQGMPQPAGAAKNTSANAPNTTPAPAAAPQSPKTPSTYQEAIRAALQEGLTVQDIKSRPEVQDLIRRSVKNPQDFERWLQNGK